MIDLIKQLQITIIGELLFLLLITNDTFSFIYALSIMNNQNTKLTLTAFIITSVCITAAIMVFEIIYAARKYLRQTNVVAVGAENSKEIICSDAELPSDTRINADDEKNDDVF